MFRSQTKSKAVSREAKNLARLTKGMGLSKSQIRELGRTLHAPSAAPATTRRAPQTTANRIAATKAASAARYRSTSFRPTRKTAAVIAAEMKRDQAAERSRIEVESLRYNALESKKRAAAAKRLAPGQVGGMTYAAARRAKGRSGGGGARMSLEKIEQGHFDTLERGVRERAEFLEAMRATGQLSGARQQELTREMTTRISQMTTRGTVTTERPAPRT